MTVLNVFNLERFISDCIGGFDDSIYIIDSSINQIKLSVNSVFDSEGLMERIVEEFPQGDFQFSIIALVMIINF